MTNFPNMKQQCGIKQHDVPASSGIASLSSAVFMTIMCRYQWALSLVFGPDTESSLAPLSPSRPSTFSLCANWWCRARGCRGLTELYIGAKMSTRAERLYFLYIAHTQLDCVGEISNVWHREYGSTEYCVPTNNADKTDCSNGNTQNHSFHKQLHISLGD